MNMEELMHFDTVGRRKQEERIESRERMERAVRYQPARQRVTIKDNRTGKTIDDVTQTVYHVSGRE